MIANRKYLILFFFIIGLFSLIFSELIKDDESSTEPPSKVKTLKKITPKPFKNVQKRPETDKKSTTKTPDKIFFCQIRNILNHYNMRHFYGEIEVKNNSVFFYSPNKQNSKHINTFITTDSSLNDGKAVVYGATVDGGLALSTRLNNSKTRLTGDWAPYPSDSTSLRVTEQKNIVIRAPENGRECSKKVMGTTSAIQPVLKQPSSNGLDKALEETFATMDKRQSFAKQAEKIITDKKVTLENNKGYIVIDNGVISVYSLINGKKGALNYRHSIDDTYEQGRIMVLGKKPDKNKFIINIQLPSDNQYYQINSKGEPTVKY